MQSDPVIHELSRSKTPFRWRDIRKLQDGDVLDSLCFPVVWPRPFPGFACRRCTIPASPARRQKDSTAFRCLLLRCSRGRCNAIRRRPPAQRRQLGVNNVWSPPDRSKIPRSGSASNANQFDLSNVRAVGVERRRADAEIELPVAQEAFVIAERHDLGTPGTHA